MPFSESPFKKLLYEIHYILLHSSHVYGPAAPANVGAQSLQGAANKWKDFFGKYKKNFCYINVLHYHEGSQEKSCTGAAKSLNMALHSSNGQSCTKNIQNQKKILFRMCIIP